MGQLSLGWGYVGGGGAFGRFANRPYIRTGGIHTGMRGSRLHGNDGATAPVHPHPNLLPSREKGPDIRTGGHPHPNPLPEGEGIFPPTWERRRWFAKTTYAANVMAGAAAQWGSCRWVGGMLGVAGPSGGSRTAPTSVQGASTQGCEVPVFTGTTGAQPPFTLILAFSPQGRRDLSAPYT